MVLSLHLAVQWETGRRYSPTCNQLQMIRKRTDEDLAVIESLIEAYLDSRRNELSKATLRAYQVQFEQFLDWCDEQDVRE